MNHSENFEKVRKYYTNGTWSEQRVKNAVGRWITEAEKNEILLEKSVKIV